MVMRVVAGTARGRRLVAPAGGSTRPTPNRAREAVFNSLYSMGAISGAAVLDLYAGTGALGIEALSRGASEATFVERDPASAAALRANLGVTGLAGRATVMAVDADAALGAIARRGLRFDLALIDPPYAFDDWPRLLRRVPAEVFVIESDRAVDVGPGLRVHHRRRHGGTVVTIATAAAGGPNQCGDQ